MTFIYNTSATNGPLSDSLGFTGSALYVVEGGRRVSIITDGVVSGIAHTAAAGSTIECVGIGDMGRQVVLYGERTGGTGGIYFVELDGGAPTLIATYGAGECLHVMQQGTLVYWTTTLGDLYTYALGNATSTAAYLSPIASLNGANGGITSVTKYDSLLYASNSGNSSAVRVESLAPFVASSPVLLDAVWASFPLNGTEVRGIVTLNDAVVVATNTGIHFYFSFGPGPVQFVARTILAGAPGVRGLATDAGVALLAGFASLLWVVVMAFVFL